MDPVRAARIRRQWPALAAVAVLALFMLVHTLAFLPAAARYRRAIEQASALGLMVDPAHPNLKPVIPVNVFTLLMNNSLPATEADARSQSGALGAEAVQALSSAAARHGLEIVVAEPGLVTQQAAAIEVRAHLRLRGRYADFAAMVDDLAHGERLWTIERFTLAASGAGRAEIEVWMAGCVLRRTGSGS